METHNRSVRTAGIGTIVIALLAVALWGFRAEPQSIEAEAMPGRSTRTLPASTVSVAKPSAATEVCAATDPAENMEAAFDRIVGYYNTRDHESLVALLGDGTVSDNSLVPGESGHYADIQKWIEAATRQNDVVVLEGVGVGDVFSLYVKRRNDDLRDAGIDELSVVFDVSASDSCSQRILSHDEISSPDACRYSALVESVVGGCADSFAPRMGHVSIWTGDELLILGGSSGTTGTVPRLPSLAWSPETDRWRQIATLPDGFLVDRRSSARWLEDRAILVGTSSESGVRVLSYWPSSDSWTTSDRLPGQRYGPGAVAISDEHVVIVGGGNKDPRDDAWEFNLDSATWRQLPDPGIRPVEDMSGLWTGTEMIFAGGYAHLSRSPDVAWNPATQAWRELPASPMSQLTGAEMIWTGEVAVMVGGNNGPAHESQLQVYNPQLDTWALSAPLPIPAVEHLIADWSGSELVLWGGHGTYSNGGVSSLGASYDPTGDVWSVLPPAPLSGRCYHSGTWTTHGLVVFGGLERCGQPNVLARGDAWLLSPELDSWSRLER